MTRKLVLRPEAEAEVLSARDWHEAQSDGLGERFVTAIEGVVQTIVERPEMYPRVHGEVRRAVVRKFRYAIFYRVSTDEIVVLSIMHGRRHPSRLQSRNG